VAHSVILATQEADRRIQISLGKYFLRPYLEKAHHKKAGGMAQGVGSEFKPQNHTHQKTKNKKKT
jgi:hypothetical protein